MATTIRDVAKHSNVSVATISKYLNGKYVKESTKQKIERSIQELHYVPNSIARSLVTSQSHTVGVLLPFISNEFCSQIVQSFINEMSKNGYGVLLCDCENKLENESAQARFLIEKNIDGILAMPLSHNPEFVQTCKSNEIPVVILDHLITDNNVDIVLTDNIDATYQVTTKLLKMGHRKIAFLYGDKNATIDERLNGFIKAMYNFGILPDEKLIRPGKNTFDIGRREMENILEGDRPTAVIAGNYDMTLGAYRAIIEKGLVIGKDIAFVGFDNMNLTKIIYPEISVIEQQASVIGLEAASMMMKRIEKDYTDFPQIKRIPVQFHYTDSVFAIQSGNQKE